MNKPIQWKEKKSFSFIKDKVNVAFTFIIHQYSISFVRKINQNLLCFQSLWFSPNQLPPPKISFVSDNCFTSFSKTKQGRKVNCLNPGELAVTLISLNLNKASPFVQGFRKEHRLLAAFFLQILLAIR